MILIKPIKRVDYYGKIFTHLKLREDRFAQTRNEIELFLDGERHLHTKAFAKDVMFSHEISSNNLIEGYGDDVTTIRKIIESRARNGKDSQAQRILNLYHGYNYILKEDKIDKETLRKLYGILSKGLLEKADEVRMGEYYRTDDVYILKGGRLNNEPDHRLPADRIDEFMDAYFNFLNSLDFSSSITEEYIKSQILHFYFVYIHPYFDVNGRTSRTIAMWYLLKKKAYPYIIFNRGITFKGTEYDIAIMDVKTYHDISFFIDYMLKTVQVELEKEYIMQCIANSTNAKLTAGDWQTMLYILSMNGLVTVSDFSAMYNRFNSKVKTKDIYESMILPLISKGILEVERQTKGYMFNDVHNKILRFNPNVLDYNPEKIRRLVKYK